MAFKLLDMAQLRWRPSMALSSYRWFVPGVKLADGVRVDPRNMSLSQLTINLGKPPDRDRRSTTFDNYSIASLVAALRERY
jgi:hypothetical protein